MQQYERNPNDGDDPRDDADFEAWSEETGQYDYRRYLAEAEEAMARRDSARAANRLIEFAGALKRAEMELSPLDVIALGAAREERQEVA